LGKKGQKFARIPWGWPPEKDVGPGDPNQEKKASPFTEKLATKNA